MSNQLSGSRGEECNADDLDKALLDFERPFQEANDDIFAMGLLGSGKSIVLSEFVNKGEF